jgi:hypothetical protein
MAHVAQLVATNARERTRCLFATQQRPYRVDSLAPPVWCVGRRFAVRDGAERAAFLRTLRSRLWVTYRHGFPTIAGSTLTNDAGWGCMIRSGQMMLAQTLMRKRFGDAWTRRCTDTALSARDRHAYVSLISMFADDRDAPFSLHRIVACAAERGKRPGEWVGPNTIAGIIKVLLDEHEAQVRASCRAWGRGGATLNIAVSVSGSQGHLYFDDVERDIAEAIARAAAACELPKPPTPTAPPLAAAAVERDGVGGGGAPAKASASPPASAAARNSAVAQRTWNPVTGFMPSVGDMLTAVTGGARTSAAPPPRRSAEAGSAEASPRAVATAVWPPSFSLLLLLPLSAGSGVMINPIYSAQLTRLLRLGQSVGCVGGVRAKGLYFVGTQSASERRCSSDSSPRATAPLTGGADPQWQAWPWRSGGAATATAVRELRDFAEGGGDAKRGSAAGAGGRAGAAAGRASAARSASASATVGGAAGTGGCEDDILFYLDPHIAQPSVFAAARSGAFTAAQLKVRCRTPPLFCLLRLSPQRPSLCLRITIRVHALQ